MLDKPRHSAADPMSKCTLSFSLHLLMRLWLYVARDFDHISFLLKWLVQYDSTGLSMLRMLLGFGPTYFYWVVTTCHIDTCFRQEGHWVVSEVCFISISSMLPISYIARLDASLNTIPSFTKSLRIEILFGPALFPCWLISRIFASSCKIASWEFFCTRRSMSTSCFCSTFGSGSCTNCPGLFPVPVVKPLTSLVPSRVPYWVSHFATTFEVLVTTSLQIGCCCCTSQLLFSVTLGAGLGVESLSNITRCPLSEIILKVQSPGTGLWVMIANDSVCKNCSPKSCASDNFIPKRHPDPVSNYCNSALSEELCKHHEVLLRQNLHHKGSDV